MSTLDHDTLRALRAKIDAALAIVAKENGILLQLGNASFDPVGGTAKFALNLAVPNAAAGAEDVSSITDAKAIADWNRQARLFGLQPEWRGRTAKRSNGTTAQILGLMPNRRKYPVLCLVDGKRLLLTTTEVVSTFANV